jgi:hypothetical protein
MFMSVLSHTCHSREGGNPTWPPARSHESWTPACAGAADYSLNFEIFAEK